MAKALRHPQQVHKADPRPPLPDRVTDLSDSVLHGSVKQQAKPKITERRSSISQINKRIASKSPPDNIFPVRRNKTGKIRTASEGAMSTEPLTGENADDTVLAGASSKPAQSRPGQVIGIDMKPLRPGRATNSSGSSTRTRDGSGVNLLDALFPVRRMKPEMTAIAGEVAKCHGPLNATNAVLAGISSALDEGCPGQVSGASPELPPPDSVTKTFVSDESLIYPPSSGASSDPAESRPGPSGSMTISSSPALVHSSVKLEVSWKPG